MKLWIEKELFQWETERYVNISLDSSDSQITFIQFYNNENEFLEEKEFKEKEGGNDIIAIIKICFHVDETQENIERYGYDPSGWIVKV